LHSNIQHTEWHQEPDLAGAQPTVWNNPEAAVAVLFNIPLARPKAAAATVSFNSLQEVAVELT